MEDPTPLLSEINVGGNHREAEVDHHDVHDVRAKADVLRRITTTEVTDEKHKKSNSSSRLITAWSYDMEGNAERCVDKYCGFAAKSVGY